MTRLLKWLDYLTPFATATWLIALVVILYWKFLDNPTPVTINSIMLLPDAPHHSGDTVTLHVDVCQNVPGVPGSGVRKIIGPGPNGYTHLLSESYVDPLPECTRHDRHIPLPP